VFVFQSSFHIHMAEFVVQDSGERVIYFAGGASMLFARPATAMSASWWDAIAFLLGVTLLKV
jgi:hypothetical protein